ncbi:MAG: hypothetical protein QXK71_04440 [Pyrobaculum sp.]|jgi:NADH-quinone oxidoreductase subunit A
MIGFVIFVVILTAAVVGLVVLGYLLAPKARGEIRERRFEAGNPPFGEVKRRLVMQYVGYIYLVTAVEAVVGLLIVGWLWLGVLNIEGVLAVAAALAIVAAYVAKYIKKISDISLWS